MAIFKKKGDKNGYSFRDPQCIGRDCFNPGIFQHYNSSISGQRSVTNTSPTCMRRAYHGCPDDCPWSKELELKRKKEGWRVVNH